MTIISGVSAATSSISIPPAAEAIITGHFAIRSLVIPRYISVSISTASSINTFRTGRPDISIPRIFSAHIPAATLSSAIFTPPALPRPPTRTCALTTTLPPISAAISTASTAVDATFPFGIEIPYLANRLLL